MNDNRFDGPAEKEAGWLNSRGSLNSGTDGDTPTPPARVDARKLAPAFEQAIRRLRPKYHRVVMLRLVEERSYDNIAEIMDLPLGTVKGYLHRAKQELRDMLGPPSNFSRSDSALTPV